jgi:F-type H+-transporting ATPase subunit delta
MKISKQSRRDAKALFGACRVNGVLDESRVRQAVTSVIAGKPRGYVATLTHFQRLVKLDLDRRSACVENAVESTPALREAIQQNLTRRYGPGVNVTFRVNPALIGGLRIKVGSDVFDGSVAARLAALEESL